MKDFEESLERWKHNVQGEDRKQLDELIKTPKDLEDAFYRELTFGTAGLRGIIGLGPNRMNVYTVAKATQGLADYLNEHFDEPSVAIARDSRHGGEAFVEAAACVLAANKIHSLVYDQVAPTPALSFAVRHFGCAGGINITASHNPSAYNGYKAYGADGCQITSETAREIQSRIDATDIFDDVSSMPIDEARRLGLVSTIGQETLDAFVDAVFLQSRMPDCDAQEGLSVVYTPLNGTGLYCVEAVLKRVGGVDVHVVPEQREVDGDFPTCPYPNPETREALERGLALCEDVGSDLLIATDPDADRVGIAVAHHGEYIRLTGNEVGVLLFDFLCKTQTPQSPEEGGRVAVTTLVSTLMADAIANDHGCELRRVLTGFKYIGEQIALLEADGQEQRFLFGFEESYGYLAGTHVRDKDAIVATMLIVQMARYYKGQGMTLVDAMDALYSEYGYFLNRTVSVEYPGIDGAEKMSSIMDALRNDPPSDIAGLSVETFVDYSQGSSMPVINAQDKARQTLPCADMVSFALGDGVQVLIRPSGTEPKIKAYVFSCASTRAESERLLEQLADAVSELLKVS